MYPLLEMCQCLDVPLLTTNLQRYMLVTFFNYTTSEPKSDKTPFAPAQTVNVNARWRVERKLHNVKQNHTNNIKGR